MVAAGGSVMQKTRSKPMSRFGRSVAGAVAGLVAMCGGSGAALADVQNNLVTPTGWIWLTGVDEQTITDWVNDDFRIVDIEVEDSAGPVFSAAFVKNEGEYQRGWWWYFGQTEAEVDQRMADHNARLIDLEPYETPSGIRYAIVLIPNTGDDEAADHGWETNQTFEQLNAFVNNPQGRRILDIQPYRENGQLRYAYVWVENSGNQAENMWWVWANTSPGVIADGLSANNARLIDLEPHDGTDTFTALAVPNDGNAWHWFYNMQFDDVSRLAGQFATRITDLQRYTTSGGQTRYATVNRRNANNLTIAANSQMRQFLELNATSGFLLRRLNGGPSTLASVFRERIFEPASTIKTAHHFAAMREVALGNTSLLTPIAEFPDTFTSCPDTSLTPVFRPLGDVLREMMENSSNPGTEAVRSFFGTPLIENMNAAFGTDIALNHMLGCLCSFDRNEMTLLGLSNLHLAVVEGALLGVRDEFYDLMSNGSNFGRGSFSTTTVRDEELAASSLTASEQQEFRNAMLFAHKGGSYTCNPASGPQNHRSRGAYVRIPHRQNCRTVFREYFIGAWVNDASSGDDANDAVGAGISEVYRDVLRLAIDSWENDFCPCGPSDFNGDGVVDLADVTAFIIAWQNQDPSADLDHNGIFDLADVVIFIQNFQRGCD